MKTCTECGADKDESDFYFMKTVGRYMAKCKRCFIDLRKEYRREYKKLHPERVRAEKRRHYQRNKDKINSRERNSDSRRAYSAAYNKKRLREDSGYRLKSNIKRMIRGCLKSNGYTKKSRTFEIIGCDFDFFKKHIELQFLDGMSWDLIGARIHIDHIIPLATAKSEEDIIRLNHYTNLRPLWAEDNLAKGSKVLTLI